jgi:hypothetical protein
MAAAQPHELIPHRRAGEPVLEDGKSLHECRSVRDRLGESESLSPDLLSRLKPSDRLISTGDQKIPDVSRRQGGAAGPGDGANARVGFGNWPPGPTPARSDVRELTSCGAVGGQHAIRKTLRENQVYNRLQGLPPPAFRQQGNAVEQLQL